MNLSPSACAMRRKGEGTVPAPTSPTPSLLPSPPSSPSPVGHRAASAAGDAAYYTAQAFAARLPQRKIQLFAAAGQAAIAAGIYGGKAVLGGRGGGGGGGGGAGGGSRALTAEGGGREGGGETTINVNFPGFVVGREADVAKQLKSLTAPLAGTGYGT